MTAPAPWQQAAPHLNLFNALAGNNLTIEQLTAKAKPLHSLIPEMLKQHEIDELQSDSNKLELSNGTLTVRASTKTKFIYLTQGQFLVAAQRALTLWYPDKAESYLTHIKIFMLQWDNPYPNRLLQKYDLHVRENNARNPHASFSDAEAARLWQEDVVTPHAAEQAKALVSASAPAAREKQHNSHLRSAPRGSAQGYDANGDRQQSAKRPRPSGSASGSEPPRELRNGSPATPDERKEDLRTLEAAGQRAPVGRLCRGFANAACYVAQKGCTNAHYCLACKAWSPHYVYKCTAGCNTKEAVKKAQLAVKRGGHGR